MPITLTITPEQASAELEWRAMPKPRPARSTDTGAAKGALSADLAKLAGTDLAQAKAQAKKALAPKAPKAPKALKHGRTASGRPVSEVAWELRAALYARGVKRTYAQCVEAVKANLV